MAKITQRQLDAISLIKRSPHPDGDGWVKCTENIFRQVFEQMPAALVDKWLVAGSAPRVRLTAEGHVIAEWCL